MNSPHPPAPLSLFTEGEGESRRVAPLSFVPSPAHRERVVAKRRGEGCAEVRAVPYG